MDSRLNPISGEELKRRIDSVSRMRDLILKLRQAAFEAHEIDPSVPKPLRDIRSDYDYWRRIAEEKGILPPE